jgi:membrane protease YdiL (CAAX protease family)
VALAGWSGYRTWKRARDPSMPPAPRRLTRWQLFEIGGRQLLFAAILAVSWQYGAWTRESVGIPGHIRWPDTILAGEVGFLAVILVYAAVVWLARRLAPMRLAAVRGNLRLWPRGRAAKWFAALFIMVFNPFVEELVMRGLLIHQWGLVLGSPVLPIVAGFLLNAMLHLYQGWRMQLWHALYFVTAVVLLYSPWGLPAAMVAHVFGDVLPILALRRQLKSVRRSRQRARRAAIA